MKKVTYPEDFLLGRVQVSLQKGFFIITIEKHMDYREKLQDYVSCARLLYGVPSCLLHLSSKNQILFFSELHHS